MAASSSSSSYPRSSSNITGRWTYDVFLSFRGEDTRKNFVDHLYTALDIRGIYTFKDDQRLLTGEPISEQLSTAIEESRFAVVVFSQNYAGSAWCLDELVHIMECRKEIRQTVVPVFYKVDPSEVRRHRKSFGAAFRKHENRYDNERIQSWKDAMFEITGLSGFDVRNTANGHEAHCIIKIVEEISSKCRPILNGERNLVGINSRVKYIKSLLGTQLDVVRFLGIWGIGGSGKTTLAWALYNEISYDQFEGKIFVDNVKEHSGTVSGLQDLQQKILSEILLDKSLKVKSLHHGIELMGSRLRSKKVLLVLDDVDDDDQLDALAASHEWFGKGSRIIITTRDQRWLTRPAPSIEMYNASLLNLTEAVQLFSLYAFGKDSPPEEYKNDSNYLVLKAGGFPLALKALGASLYDSTMDEWKSALSRLEVEGEEDKVSKMLKVSYDGLSKIDQKILLDIACFFRGEKKDRVIRILDSFDFHAHFGIKRLFQRSLIYFSNGRIHMHDRIQEMGWHIVQKSSDKPGERSRLWLPNDVLHVLTKNTGTDSIEGISFATPHGQDAIRLDSRSFENMNQLRLLELKNDDRRVPVKFRGPSKENKYPYSNSRSSIKLECLSNLRWLTWKDYHSDSLQEFFGTVKLVGLEMPGSQIVQLWEDHGELRNGRKSLANLRYIDLTDSCMLKQTPDVNMTPNLHTLILERCSSLVEVHPSIGNHEQLVFLSLKGCYSLEYLPSSIGMKSLETLVLSECEGLRKFPDIKGNMKRLSKLYLDFTSIEELPLSIKNLSGLVLMDLTFCKHLTSLPSTISELKCLKILDAKMCGRLMELPENLGQIQSLEGIWLNWAPIKEAPSSMALLKNLKTLSLSRCTKFVGSMFSTLWPNSTRASDRLGLGQPLLPTFYSIRSLYLDYCNIYDEYIPTDLSALSSLEELSLQGNRITYLPQGICQLPRLKILDVSWCNHLHAFEALPLVIAVLKADGTAEETSFPHISSMYESLWKISFCTPIKDLHPTTCILKSLLQGPLVANHRFSLRFVGCNIPMWFREKSPHNHPYMQLPLKWYKEDILGFAISTVCDDYYNGYIDIQFDLIEESNSDYVPHAPIHKSSYRIRHPSVWLGFISFDFFQLLFPEINWSAFTGTVGVCIGEGRYINKCKQVAIRPVYKEDVERVPMIQKVVRDDPTGRPWLEQNLSYGEDLRKLDSNGQETQHFSSNTAYFKERGRLHARLVFNA